MRTAKKLWLYSGLAVPQGVAYVRREPVKRTFSPTRLLLLGGHEAQGVAVPLSRMTGFSGAAMHVDIDARASTRDWAKSDKLKSHLAVFRPTWVIFALDPSDMLARRCIRAKLRKAGARDVWMTPPGVDFPESARCIPAPEANVAGFAAWAARVWAMVR